VIDGYGASEPAKFFAVVTEVFFGQLHDLAAEAPAVYGELVALHGVNPVAW